MAKPKQKPKPRGPGRPPSDNPRDRRTTAHMTEAEFAALAALSERSRYSMSALLVRGALLRGYSKDARKKLGLNY